jgi:hypothetical protein
VGLAACVVAGATSAQAQAVYRAPPPGYVPVSPPAIYGGLPPSEILMIVRASGLRPLTQPARQGPRQYVLLASDNMGGQLRVVVNAFSGRIVHAAPAYDPRFAYRPARPRGYVPMPAPQHSTVVPPPSYRAAPPADLREPTPPLPRTARTTPSPQAPAARASQNPSRQNSRLASAPDSAGSVPARPVRTPLPRPRPVVAASEAAAPAPAAPTRRALQETSPEAEAAPAAQPAPAPAPPSAAPAQPAPAETQLVPVAPLD